MSDRHEVVLDGWLVLKSREGDADAFSRLVARWQERLWRHAYRRTGSDAAAWDVVQESWISISKGLLRLRDPARFGPWAYSIVTRRAADLTRGREATSSIEDTPPPLAPPTNPEEDPRVTALRAIVHELDPEARTLVWLRFVEGYDLARIATAMDLPEGTVKSRLHHLKQKLRERLERMNDE